MSDLTKTTQSLILEQQKLVILQSLADYSNYTANNFLLQNNLITNGLATSQAELIVIIEQLNSDKLVNKYPLITELTQLGLDVALGNTSFDGIAKPAAK